MGNNNEQFKQYKPSIEGNYYCVYTIDEIDKYLNLEEFAVVASDFECAAKDSYRSEPMAALDSNKADIVGISLSVKSGTGIYIPLAHEVGKNADNPIEVINYLAKAVYENDDIIKVCHNIAYESAILYKYGITIKAPVFDTICASQLTLKNDMEFRELRDSGLKKLVPELLGVTLPTFSEVVQEGHFDELNPQDEKTINYACADSDYALRLYHVFTQWFRQYMPNHLPVCEVIESPTAVYTGLMKHNGISVDKDLIDRKHTVAEKKLNHLREKINYFAGRELKIGVNASTKDFKDYLYQDLKLPVLKTTTKLKEAADDETFILLKQWCKDNKPHVVEFLETVQEYRKWSKLKSTYIDGLIKCINTKTGKIHTDFFPMGTETGRFSSRNPNLQNLPRKDNDPIGVRDFFVPSPGNVFLSFDFSQIELRVGAYFCQDETMVQTYKEDGDIHGITTSLIYNIPFQEAVDKNVPDYKERRTIAKNCNFGVFYGLYPKGLQSTLKFKAAIEKSEFQCASIITNIKRGYPRLEPWQIETKKKASIRKYSETALGRRRYLKGINSMDYSVRSYWERCAMNTPIQGTAADILKLAIGRILDGLPERPYIKPVLQIHDELVFEVRKDKIKEAMRFIQMSMEEQPFQGFNIPIKAECEVGFSFGKMRSI